MQTPSLDNAFITPLCEEIEKELDPLKSQVEIVTSNYCFQETKKSQFDSLKFENDIIKEELETEERWMRRIANEALDSEENNLLIILKCLWYLSTKEPNCYDIINREEVVEIIANAIDISLDTDINSTAFGIFGNLCQSNQTRDILYNKYPELLVQMIINAKQIISSSIVPSRSLQMSLIFLYNLSPHDKAAEIMAQNWIFDTLSNLLLDNFDDQNIIDLATQILMSLFNNKKLKMLMYLSYETMSEIYKSLKRFPKTSISINLISLLKEAFPSVELLSQDSE